MIRVGYMAKKVAKKPDSLRTAQVEDIYSVSGCISPNFADYINFWSHNGYWFFDSPEIIRDIAQKNQIDLTGTTMFYYEVYELQYYEDESKWSAFSPEKSFLTNVVVPPQKKLMGYDIVSFQSGNTPECSYLSCNYMAERLKVNRHCLLESLTEAKQLLNNKVFVGCEPGPCRIFAVYQV